MKKSILLLSLLTLVFSTLIAQDATIKKVKYAASEINVPTGYTAKNEYSIENDSFSAQWLYLSKEMVDQGFDKQLMGQLERQLRYSNATDVEFVSNGGQLSGKKYKLKANKGLKFRILAFGAVTGQPLVLNLGFKEDPISNAKSDDLMKKFILLNE